MSHCDVPVSQTVSYHNYIVMKKVIEPKRGILELVENKELIENPQVRQLCGAKSFSGRCDEAVLQCAKNNLEQYFTVVGVTDRFNDFVSYWLNVNNWPGVALSSSASDR